MITYPMYKFWMFFNLMMKQKDQHIIQPWGSTAFSHITPSTISVFIYYKLAWFCEDDVLFRNFRKYVQYHHMTSIMYQCIELFAVICIELYAAFRVYDSQFAN